jgi:hypothetical protein
MFPEIMVQINFDALPCAGKKTFLELRFRNSQCRAHFARVASLLRPRFAAREAVGGRKRNTHAGSHDHLCLV